MDCDRFIQLLIDTVACTVIRLRLYHCNALLVRDQSWQAASSQKHMLMSSLDYVGVMTSCQLSSIYTSCRSMQGLRSKLQHSCTNFLKYVNLAELVSSVPARTLWSLSKTLLTELYFHLKLGRRSFRCVATMTWNNIPDDIRPMTSGSSRQHLDISIQTVIPLITDALPMPMDNIVSHMASNKSSLFIYLIIYCYFIVIIMMLHNLLFRYIVGNLPWHT